MMITGSAPISNEVLTYLKIVYCCPIFEAYGLTETSGAITLTCDKDGQAGHVGGPLVN